jgi:CDP-diacylglycerol--glycerol-3-phosphate 3-phosphatidyltransferase
MKKDSQPFIDKERVKVRKILLTWSNLISFSRILATFPIIYLHQRMGQEAMFWISLLIIYIIVSDYLDGLIARLTNQISEWGKLLDPIADKIAALILFLYVFSLGRIPTPFLVFAVIRDLLIMSGSAFIRHKAGKVPMSVWSGKVAVNVLSAYWLVVFYRPEWTQTGDFLLGATVTIMLYSFFDYFHRFYLILQGADFN